MTCTGIRLSAAILSTGLMVLYCHPVLAQGRGGKNGGGGGGGVAKGVAGSRPVINQGAGQSFSNPFGSSISLNIGSFNLGQNSFGNNVGRSAASYGYASPTVVNPSPVRRQGFGGGGFVGGYRPGVVIPRGNTFFLPVFSLGGVLRNGFDPYVLQGFSNNAPQVFSTPIFTPAFAAQPVFVNNAFPGAAGTSGLRSIQVEFSPTPASTPTPPVPKSPMAAAVQVIVPHESAELWFNGVKTQTSGPRREFVTPELPPGQSYTYEVRVRWTQDGKIYELTRFVTVQAGGQATLNLLDLREQLPPPIGIKV